VFGTWTSLAPLMTNIGALRSWSSSGRNENFAMRAVSSSKLGGASNPSALPTTPSIPNVPPLAGEGGFDRTVKHHRGVDLACETGSSRDDAVSGSVSHLTECERGCEARDHTTSDDPPSIHGILRT
jgi:hypothetical protein